ncbi:acyltransferase [Iamia sp. SCSIO 61187]|uniref:acyltransferase family protein n=1 Tax=Iamia sp. SCSIO 61187 TaxID=2722752 RepID=UPI001C625D29|nr:acyltransferase [Iamia sp. SCSIO 61187]QYG91124.1 acyltransferase [Iamia sp. SCSIO 61187]
MPTATATTPDVGLDALVAATPAHRDRTVDAVRALCIVVVVLWHWVFSITHVRADGALTMPNPIDEIPAGWLATWVLQVMPAFFVVGGFANLASWQRLERDGAATWRAYAAGRLARLGRPLAAVVVAWGVADTVARAALGVPSVTSWGMVVFVPLWFMGAYSAVLLLAPATIGAHRRHPLGTLGALAAGIAVADGLRFSTGEDRWGYVTTALVWVTAHQLGYLWRDGTVTTWGRRAQAGLAVGAAATLALLTGVGPYPPSMVAVRGGGLSNMFPTTAPIAVLAVLQLGLIALGRPAAERWLARRGPWRAVVAVNAVAMTVFAWHMTALVAVIGVAVGLGLTLPSETSPTWWLLRPVWLVLPGLVLAGLVAVFARLELPRPRR